MIADPTLPRRWLKPALAIGAMMSLSAATGWAAARIAAPASPDTADVRAALKLRLPKTPIDEIRCAGFGDLCEVTSKTTLFYVDRTAKYLVIGRLYDMEARTDLTAARLLALNPDLLAAGGAKRASSDDGPAPKATPRKVPLAGLPANGAIQWGPTQGPKVVVFSDFHCSYCKKLEAELRALGARVEERPISIFGKDSRALAERVLCSSDPARAVARAYADDEIPASAHCDTSGLDANEVFAKAHGFNGTPVIVRPSDGTVLEGYRPAATLRAFLTTPTKG